MQGYIVLPDCDKPLDTRLRQSEANWAKFTILLSSSSVSGIKSNSYTFTKQLSSHVRAAGPQQSGPEGEEIENKGSAASLL